MRRVLAVAAVAAAFAAPVPASATHYGTCGGIVDIHCTGTTCSLDCFSNPCSVWLDPLDNPHSAVCVPDVPLSDG